MNFCPKWTRSATEGVRHEEKYNSKSCLHWGSTGIPEEKGLHLMERGKSVSLDMGSATSQWKLPCLLREASRKTERELLFLFLVQDFTSRKGSLTWSYSFSSQVWLFLLLLCFLCTWSSRSCLISLSSLLVSATQAKVPVFSWVIAFEVCLPVLGFWWRFAVAATKNRVGAWD